MSRKSPKNHLTQDGDDHHQDLRSDGKAPLSEIAKKVRAIEINTRRFSTASLAGQYRSRFRGQGMQGHQDHHAHLFAGTGQPGPG